MPHSILKKIRLKIARFLLRKKTAKMKRQKILFDFSSAKHVGILCSPHDETSAGQIKDFLYFLSHKDIRYSVFGYFDKKNIPANFLYLRWIDFITRKDLNFFFMPKGQIVDRFINERFDMLIICNLVNYFPMNYIAQLSKASCKVGIMHHGETNYDLMIDIQKNRSIEYFLKNLEIYLTNIRNPK